MVGSSKALQRGSLPGLHYNDDQPERNSTSFGKILFPGIS